MGVCIKKEFSNKGEIIAAIIRRDIKSFYNFKEVFSFLKIKQLLEIIIYNKQQQKELEIDIEKYKELSGKYKVDGKNGKGSEYIIKTNKLVFEDEYLNRKGNEKRKRIL